MMSLPEVKKAAASQYVAFFQILLLAAYLMVNILNVGQGGTALPLLAAFFVLSGVNLLLGFSQSHRTVYVHFFAFLIFVAWLAFRVLVDRQNMEYLKQITVATTSGIFLFFLIGTFARQALDKITLTQKNVWLIGLLILSLLVSVWVFEDFQSRLLADEDIFYMKDVDGDYQRPGNFIVMFFIMCSFLYLVFSARLASGKNGCFFFAFFTYALIMAINLINSQAMGANTATACVLAIYLMVAVLSLLVFNEIVCDKYLTGHLVFPWSIFIFKKIFKYSVAVLFFVTASAFVSLQITGFDLQKTRFFGFGSGVNTSLTSRLEILQEVGLDQMGSSPIFGNADVARLTTGDAGRTLHSFIPNIIAELGLIGLLLVFLLFVLIMSNLFDLMRRGARNKSGFILASVAFGMFLVLVFLFLYANLATGKEWSVIWFFLGFAVSVFPAVRVENMNQPVADHNIERDSNFQL